MKKLKSIISLTLMGVMLLGITSFLFGCFGYDGTVPRYGNPWQYKKEDQGFYYAVYSKDRIETATILGLVDEEMERDELVIPEKLGGFSVTQIGTIYQQLSVSNKYYGINAKNTKSILFNAESTIFNYSFPLYKGSIIINKKVSFNYSNTYTEEIVATSNSSFNYNRQQGLQSVNSFIFNVDTESITGYDYLKHIITNDSSTYGPRILREIKYEPTGGKIKTYAEFAKMNSTVKEPESPTKEGYLFKGWFKDEECQTEWNFEEDKVTETITLYAKWLTMEE